MVIMYATAASAAASVRVSGGECCGGDFAGSERHFGIRVLCEVPRPRLLTGCSAVRKLRKNQGPEGSPCLGPIVGHGMANDAVRCEVACDGSRCAVCGRCEARRGCAPPVALSRCSVIAGSFDWRSN